MNKLFGNETGLFFRTDKTMARVLMIAGLFSIAAFIAAESRKSQNPLPYADDMIRAAGLMENAVSVIRKHRIESGLPINETVDINRTGLIGTEYSGLTTSVGFLEAKRTSVAPDAAALVVRLLNEAGVKKGDAVAVGCSASFPGFLPAVYAAAEVMEVHPVIIFSLGASSYGANSPDFTLLDIYSLLKEKGLIGINAAAVSLGGEQDTGDNIDPEIKERLTRSIRESGLLYIYEPDLKNNVSSRMKIYAEEAADKKIAAFINVGGGHANIGTSEKFLEVKPGLNTNLDLPPEEEQGVLFQMAALDISIIHLLYIKGLSEKQGILWDPSPFPNAGETELYFAHEKNGILFYGTCFIYFSVLLLAYLLKRNRSVSGKINRDTGSQHF